MQKKIKKIIPYCFVLIILVGLFSLGGEVNAQEPAGVRTCSKPEFTTPTACRSNNGVWTDTIIGTCAVSGTSFAGTMTRCGEVTGSWSPATAPAGTPVIAPPAAEGLGAQIPGCAVITGDFDDCIVKITYVIFYTIPAFFLGLAATSFNLIISLTLSSTLYTKSTFIPEAWGVVRDLSNIFFILILLYIAIKTILGMGGSEVKKMVVQVIIMALLINFSMFFSKIIIDSANILALVFYNRINVETKIGTGANAQVREYFAIGDPAKTGIEEKDIAGGIVSAFDPSRMLSAEFFEKARTQTQVVATWSGLGAFVGGGAIAGSFIPFVGTAVGAGVGAAGYLVKSAIGFFVGSKDVPVPLMLGIILVSGLTMAFAAYSFFIVGLAFLSRLIELWVLIIFSPFAFMSSSVPFLSKAEGIGWDEWIKSIVRVSFMAPFFMFFLYLIFKLINANLFANISTRTFEEQGTLEAIILMTLPAFVVLIILHKATEKAKKWSGELGDMLIKGVAVAGGIAGGLALGGGAAALQASVGKYSNRFAESATAKRWIKEKKFGADTLQKTTSYLGGASFDARKGAVGAVLGAVESTTGLRVGASSKLLVKDGGYKADRKKMVESRIKRAKELEVGEDEESKQKVYEKQAELHEVKNGTVETLDPATNELKTVRRQDHIIRLNDGANYADGQAAEADLLKADHNLKADPTNDTLKAAQKTAEAIAIEARGLANLGRGVAKAEKEVATAVTAVKDAEANLVKANATGEQEKKDEANDKLEAARKNRDARINGGTFTNADGTTEEVLLRDSLTQTRQLVLDREKAIRGAKGPILDAENALKVAENAVIAENNERREKDAESIAGGRVRQIFRAVGMQQAGDSKESRREAANKIRAGIQEEKKVSSH